jgi:alginate O-acetyltransferase complex protein AlgI
MFVVMIGWYLFSFNEISGGYGYLAALFGGGGRFMDRGSIYQMYSNAVLLIILIIGSTTLPIRAASAVLKKVRYSNTATVVLRGAFTVCVFMFSVAYLVSASYNPFLYFRF